MCGGGVHRVAGLFSMCKCLCPHAGYMSAKACASGKTVLDLWKVADQTNRQLYTVKRASGSGSIIGVRARTDRRPAPPHPASPPSRPVNPASNQTRMLLACLLAGLLALQVNTTLVNSGRASEGCAAYVSVGSASTGWCQITTAGLGTTTSPGAEQWVLEAVPGETDMVYVSNWVRGGRGAGGWAVGRSVWGLVCYRCVESIAGRRPPDPPTPHPLTNPNPRLQARAAAGCGMRYLGASTNCSVIETGLYAIGNVNALLKWQLVRV